MEDSASNITETQSDSRVQDYIALLKPRVMSLVVFTGLAGMWVAPGFSDLHPFLILVAILSLAIGAGAAGAANMWYDRDIDAVMKRTAGRPLPLGKMAANEALTFAMILTVLSVMTMGVALNWTAAGILAFASFFYIVIYTMWLKRRTPQNIVIGGAAGAFPPMVGWAAVTGNISIESIVLFAIIFFWTPPHFWALSLFANEDYKTAKIPMMTVVAGAKKTKIQMLAYAIILLPITILPSILGFAGWGYGVVAALLSLFFIFTSVRVLYSDDLKNARLMFGYSIFYLFALFLALMINGG